LINLGSEQISGDSFRMETMNLALEYFFKMPDYDDSVITQILNKLEELGWDVSPQKSQLASLREGIKNSKDHLNSVIHSSTSNIFATLDECLGAYRFYCHNMIFMDQLKNTVVILAQNYVKSASG
jgi:hypothetical protein